MRILGLDPGLRYTGWGLIHFQGNRLQFLDSGRLTIPASDDLAKRLALLFQELEQIVKNTKADHVAVEETFSNVNARSTLKLGMARGIVMAVPALAGIPVFEYAANTVKKTVVGAGHADKNQVQHMVKMLLPLVKYDSADAADALAIAICHAHHL
jgi:crossover junction endodeoxyribonuclease RuvC